MRVFKGKVHNILHAIPGEYIYQHLTRILYARGTLIYNDIICTSHEKKFYVMYLCTTMYNSYSIYARCTLLAHGSTLLTTLYDHLHM